MNHRKKILAISIKILIGVLSFWVIYTKVSWGDEVKQVLTEALSNQKTYLLILISCLFMPLNWGIESYKWKLITTDTESVSYAKAFQSVMAGVCVGNLAPGRSTEFLAKILFFKPENRSLITVLHFTNGMFQLLITIMMGVLALPFYFSEKTIDGPILYFITGLATLLLLLFIMVIFKFEWLQEKLFSFRVLKKYKPAQVMSLKRSLVASLITLSLLRYLVFSLQFYFLFLCFNPALGLIPALCGVALYFLLTSVIPMISVIEPAIRATLAMVAFQTNDARSAWQIICISTLLWMINIILPSLVGYGIILKEKFVFKKFVR